MDTKYDFKKTEEGKYDFWLKNDLFKSGRDKRKDAFSIVIPPPNVTGNLHIGHAYDCSLQDIIVRYKRLQGYDVLWLPGMDHAAIATEAKVVKKLKEQGIDKYEYGREKFLEACWDWTHEHQQNIRNQWAKMGFSLDYSKERFTLDEGLNKAVRKVFVDYYNKGLIYRGYRIINWDPVALTALSNEEVVYKDTKGAFYHLKYVIEGTKDYLDVATTRPETLFGDTAVAVNPKDERYNKLIGTNVVLPGVGRLIPIIGDEHADPEFGTGCVKITPAHDPNDYEVGIRHNLEQIICMNPDATMNEVAGKYQGMTREDCRDQLIKDLKEAGLLLDIEEMVHSVGYSERTDAMVEPYLSRQWFVKMDELSKMLIDNQKTDNKVNFVPKRFEGMLINGWMEDCHDWCISRQLWWGHRIPIWYKGEEVYCGLTAPSEEGWVQDEDVLDTWFSSALWPFSTMGWPDNTEDLERYFPTSVIVPGFDIIFFWAARMIFQSLGVTGNIPFKDCIIHGLIRDEKGRKMSKSLGNGIDPIEMIDKYGADALRFYLTTSSTLGMDLNFNEEKLSSTWNFINKIWNASRFVLLKLEGFTKEDFTLDNLREEDKWILTKLNITIKNVIRSMDKYDFTNAGAEIYNFIWNIFCDEYIEMSKISDNNTTKSVLYYVLISILKMLHPFMPFVTEEIYQNLPFKDKVSIMEEEYPKYDKKLVFKNDFDKVVEDITNIRNFKVANNITNNDAVKIIDAKYLDIYSSMLRFKNITDEDKEGILYTSDYAKLKFYVEVKEVDKEAINKEIDLLTNSIQRREKLLSNQGYVNNAPKEIVDSEREKLASEKEKLAKLKTMD